MTASGATLDGNPIFIEVSGDRPLEYVHTSKEGSKKFTPEALDQIMSTAVNLAGAARKSLQSLGADGPTSAELEFGLKLSVEGNVWVAKAASEAQFTFRIGISK